MIVSLVNEEITLAEMEAHDARLDQLDIEAAIEFAQYVLLNAARIWSESSPEQKQRLQKLIFPSGVLFAESVYRTGTTSMIFFELEEMYAQNERMVALPGCESAFFGIRHLARTRENTGFSDFVSPLFATWLVYQPEFCANCANRKTVTSVPSPSLARAGRMAAWPASFQAR